MKKILAFALAAAFALPTFALTVKVGDSIGYLPSKDGKDKLAVVTKIAPAANGAYELSLVADNISYSYVVAEGEEIKLYSRNSTKSKTPELRNITVTAVRNNEIEIEPAASSATDPK